MVEYSTHVVIDAPPERVWAILVDGGRYADWNPEILGIDGRLEKGAKIAARVRLGSGVARRVPMRVTELSAPTRMVWTGGLPFGLFIGRRTYTVAATGTGSEFRMHLQMSGPLSGFIAKSVGDRQPEIDAFAGGLKRQAERRG
jgi:uncharacterized protein YndB with AHSA1/START domain